MTELTTQVKGRDIKTGLPKTINITSTEIGQAMENSIAEIVDVIKMTLEKTPPELASDIVQRGIVLAGGGALIRNLDKLISSKTKMPVYVAENPIECVVKGTEKTLSDLEKLKTNSINSKKKR